MRTAISGTFFGAPWATIWWTQHVAATAPAQADVDNVTAAIAASMNLRFKNHQSVDCAYLLVKSTYFVPGGTILNSIAPLVTTGTSTSGSNLPANAAMGVSWISGVYWRGGKPRTYLAGYRSADVNGTTQWTSGAVAATVGNAGLFLADINALTHGAITGTALGFVSFRSGNADRPTPLFFPYLGARVHTRIDSQRRRLGKETT